MKRTLLLAIALSISTSAFAVNSDGMGGKNNDNMLCQIFKFVCTKFDYDGIDGKSDNRGISGKSNQFEGENDARSQEADDQRLRNSGSGQPGGGVNITIRAPSS